MTINIQNLINVVDQKLAALDSASPIEDIIRLQSLRNDLNASTGMLEYNSFGALPEFDSASIGKLVLIEDTTIGYNDQYSSVYYGTADGWQEYRLQSDERIDPGGHVFPGTQPGGGSTLYYWRCPASVTSVHVLLIGGGGGGENFTSGGSGGGGGALHWMNDVPVVPGTVYEVYAGNGGNKDDNAAGSASTATAGGTSYFINTDIGYAEGGGGAPYNQAGTGGLHGGTHTPSGGGNGGNGRYDGSFGGGGGGAGGYSGAGGIGGFQNSAASGAGTGGAGSGGGGGYISDTGGGGGGVGIYGEGASGESVPASIADGLPGLGGSGGDNGGVWNSTLYGGTGATGGNYGGGGGGSDTGFVSEAGDGGAGLVRIIWGSERAFPSTLTSSLSIDEPVGQSIVGS